MLETSFKLLKSKGACAKRYTYLAKALGGVRKYGRETPIPLADILRINGPDDTLWAAWATTDDAMAQRLFRLFACDCAEQVAHLWTDPRSSAAVAVARRYARGEATGKELAAAGAAAWDAAWEAARAAARDAAREAAWDAARAAAWDAAREAAGDAAWEAAWAAARAAARDAAREAAGDAAREAAWDAARAAAWDAGEAAREAAGDAARAWQTERLRQYLCGELPL